MKKTLLLPVLFFAGIQLQAQAPKVSGVKKMDVHHMQQIKADGETNFYSSATNSQRNSNPVAPQAQGQFFSSSYNAYGLLVSESHCLTADQALNVVMMTHRITPDWPADANVASGYIEYNWTPNFGLAWDSSYFADQYVLGNKAFRYPSGAIINPAGNTVIANATDVAIGPWTNSATSGNSWQGYYYNYQLMMNGATQNTNVYTVTNAGTPVHYFPRIDLTSYDDSSAWGTSTIEGDPSLTTGFDFRGAAIVKAQYSNGTVTWTTDSIKPNFHVAPSSGDADAFTISHIAFSRDGSVGYVVFFGVEGTQTTPSMRTFLPIVYKSTDHGATWNMVPMNDFTTLPAISNYLIPATGGSLKPWFNQGQGSDIIVDNNNQLHIVCTIESGSSDDDDSLGYTWTRTGLNGTAAVHYIYDVMTTSNGWNALMVDSLMTTTTSSTSPFSDGSAAFNIDARIQLSHTTDRSKLFVVWVDSDPIAVGAAENSLPDLKGVGLDYTNNMMTAEKDFTSSQDFFWHYVSNVALVNGSTYSIGVTNSIDRAGTGITTARFDHYFYEGCIFQDADFSVSMPTGINEQATSLVSMTTYPNPAHGMVSLNLNLSQSGNATLSVVNELGQNVYAENRFLVSGANTIQLNTSKFVPGVYFVSVATENGKATQRIVVE